jgi:hypothetical protein
MALSVALFESLCVKKRALGTQIEEDIKQLDASALGDVHAAENELRAAEIQRSAVIAYLDRAYEGGSLQI